MDTIDESARAWLLSVARHALSLYLHEGERYQPSGGSATLWMPRASFVTLRRHVNRRLRGCRGETRAVRPLAESVATQAVAAATEDPRFPPVEAAELPDIAIHISALTPMTPIDPAEIEIGRHGLLIARPGATGLLLPQVPALYGLESVEKFLAALCRKAGLEDRAWEAPQTALLAFEAEEWGESDR